MHRHPAHRRSGNAARLAILGNSQDRLHRHPPRRRRWPGCAACCADSRVYRATTTNNSRRYYNTAITRISCQIARDSERRGVVPRRFALALAMRRVGEAEQDPVNDPPLTIVSNAGTPHERRSQRYPMIAAGRVSLYGCRLADPVYSWCTLGVLLLYLAARAQRLFLLRFRCAFVALLLLTPPRPLPLSAILYPLPCCCFAAVLLPVTSTFVG